MAELATSFIEARSSTAVGYIEICRPEKKNALSSVMGAHLLTALRRFEADPECRAIIISGRGGDFSSGADLSEPRDPAAARRSWTNAPHALLLRAVASARIPVIVAIDGWAIGIGLGIVGAATHVVAGQGSRFTLPEVKSGYLPFAVLPHLTYRMQTETILRWALSGDVFTADEALGAGLVTQVVGTGEALSAAAELAATLTSAPREVVEHGMQFLQECRACGGAATIVSWCEAQMDSLISQ